MAGHRSGPGAKPFKLSPEDMKPLAEDRGACFASDRITVDGLPVGFMYREEPDNELDSGWRFLSGTESQEYLENPDNLAIYDVNTIANYDPSIVPLLDAPFGSAFERQDGSGGFVAVRPPSLVDEPDEGDDANATVRGRYDITHAWSIKLPAPFKRRLEDGNLVLWRPGLVAWIVAWYDAEHRGKKERMAELRGDRPPTAYDVLEEETSRLLRCAYRLKETAANPRTSAFHGFVVGKTGHVQLIVHFDEETDLKTAEALWRGVSERSG